jgi:hypothetical protein
MQRLEARGSPLYSSAWKRKTTPAGRSYLKHAASPNQTGGMAGYLSSRPALRQMYGRAGFTLLKARVLPITASFYS